MLSGDENELLCRTGPGTAMGALFRRYWHPALLSRELPEPDGPPVRVRLLGEDLVAFRASDGTVGLLQNACPHRGASLFFGRNEENGIRCVYHGWKFDVTGACVDMPNEPAESNFKHKIKARAYRTREAGDLVWAYMGPPELEPPFPEYLFLTAPADQVVATKVPVYCNYVQSLEGNIDSSHISFLHRNLDDKAEVRDGTDGPGYPSDQMSTYIRAKYRDCRIEIQETAYGFKYAGIRGTDTGLRHCRVSVHVLPVTTMVANLPWQSHGALIIVPRDDESCWRFAVQWNPAQALTPEQKAQRIARSLEVTADGRRIAAADNDYNIDRQMQRAKSMTGIVGIPNQDYAVTESMGPIYDRTREHLGTTDAAIIKFRRMLLKAARDLEHGVPPPGTQPGIPWRRIRQGERIIGPDEDWRTIESEDTEFQPLPPPRPAGRPQG